MQFADPVGHETYVSVDAEAPSHELTATDWLVMRFEAPQLVTVCCGHEREFPTLDNQVPGIAFPQGRIAGRVAFRIAQGGYQVSLVDPGTSTFSRGGPVVSLRMLVGPGTYPASARVAAAAIRQMAEVTEEYLREHHEAIKVMSRVPALRQQLASAISDRDHHAQLLRQAESRERLLDRELAAAIGASNELVLRRDAARTGAEGSC